MHTDRALCSCMWHATLAAGRMHAPLPPVAPPQSCLNQCHHRCPAPACPTQPSGPLALPGPCINPQWQPTPPHPTPTWHPLSPDSIAAVAESCGGVSGGGALVLHSEGPAAALLPPGSTTAGDRTSSSGCSTAALSLGPAASGWEQLAALRAPLRHSSGLGKGGQPAPAALPWDWELLRSAAGLVHFLALPLPLMLGGHGQGQGQGQQQVGAMLLAWGPGPGPGGGGGAALPALMTAPRPLLEQLGACVAGAAFGPDAATIGKVGRRRAMGACGPFVCV